MDKRFMAGFSAALIVYCASLSIGQVLAEREPLEMKEEKVQLGELSFVLGQNIRLARDSFSEQYKGQFSLQGLEPDSFQPEYVSYSIHSVVGEHKQWGTISFKDGKLSNVHQSVEMIEPDEKHTNVSGDVLVELIEVLEEMRAHTNEPVTVNWDNHKPGNSKLFFYSGNRQVSVVYYDSPGGSRRLVTSRGVRHSD